MDRFVFGNMRSSTSDTGWNKPFQHGLPFKWPFPKQLIDKMPRWYRIQSTFVSWGVWAMARITVARLNEMRTHNMNTFYDLWKRRGTQPLLTVANHDSCFDDPGIWGAIPWSEMKQHLLKWRWAPCAAELCFTTPLQIKCFSLGRCIPIIRGHGVYQQAIDYCIERLNANEWVHIYPEARVNADHQRIRFKWGVGRVMAESSTMPIVLPIAHVGMDDVMPNTSPYYLRRGKKVTMLVGNPVTGLQELCDRLRAEHATPREIRKALTDRVQEEMYKLQDQAKEIHRQWLSESGALR